jgi:protein-disulfide isomerase
LNQTLKVALVFIGVVVLVAGLGMLVSKREPAGMSPGREAQPPAPSAQVADPSLLVRFHSPSFGEAGAKVHIVEFLDPACSTCRAFYPFVKEMIAANPGRIRLSIRYAPFHKGSDQVIRLLEAAKKQGKYWQTLEAVLAVQPQWLVDHVSRIELVFPAVAGLGLDMAKLKEDMASPDLGNLLQQDIKDGAALEVTKTPTFFVNGRPLPRFGYEELKTLVDQALREAYS